MKKLIPNPQSLIPEKDILVYQGEAGVKMTVKTDGETVWLTQEQMSQLFGRDQSVIARHIGNIFKEKELVKDSVYAKFAYTATDHKVYQVAYYNLDVVISVGYRVKSIGSCGGSAPNDTVRQYSRGGCAFGCRLCT